MEGKLVWLLVLVLLLLWSGSEAYSEDRSFGVVVYICVWKRPLLTDFVLSHFASLKEPLKSENIDLDIFIAGSENSTIATASKFQAAYTIVPNNPLGAKHEKGLQAIRRQLLNEVTLGTRARLPDAVTIFGSDDIVNKKFFTVMKRMMRDVENPVHILGLRDLYFMDLRTKRLMYTKGYRSFKTQLSGTLGCGRVYSWKLLDTLGWKLWDTDRERGLDQSATRNVLRKIAMIGEISHAIIGKEEGVSAIDIKTDSFAKGRNIWGFEQVLKAVGANGRFYDFVEEDLGHVLRDSFEEGTEERVGQLRAKMNAEGDAV